MKTVTTIKAINEVLKEELATNEKAFIIGIDISKGTFGVTAGLKDLFPDRVIDTPISEKALMGAAVGAASIGMTAIPELMFSDFMTTCYDEIVNQCAKIRYMFGGQTALNLVLRMPTGVSRQAAAQHSQSLEALLTHIPGLKVVFPSNPLDAAGLLKGSLRDGNPVMFLEHKRLYATKMEVPDVIEPIPLGKADIKRVGKDITLVATGYMVQLAWQAAQEMAKQGIEVEIVDPRTLYPLDKETIYKSVEKTGKVLVLTEENKRGAWSAELLSNIVEERFATLKKPPVRIGALNTPIAFSPVYESYIIPRVEDIVKGLKSLI